jgi:uncharacterized protein YjbI with pentapeptide repeats
MEVLYLSRTKKIIILSVLVLTCLVLVIGYQILSGRTFYTDVVIERISDALQKSGPFELAADSIRGNIITGVYLANASVLHEGTPIISADEIAIRLVLPSLLSSNPSLSSITMTGMEADYDLVSSRLETGASSSPPPLRALYLRDSLVRTPWGEVEIGLALVALGGDSYKVDLDGALRGEKISLSAKTLAQSGITTLEELELRFADTLVKASGALAPKLDLQCDLSGVEMAYLEELMPSIKNSPLEGVYSARLGITNEQYNNKEGFVFTGTVSSKQGRIWKFPFNSLDALIRYAGAKLELRNLTASSYKGKANGAADLKFIQDGSTELLMALVLNSVDTREMLGEFPWLEKFSGVVDAVSCDITGPLSAVDARALFAAREFSIAGVDCSDVRMSAELKKSSTVNLSYNAKALGASASGSAKVVISPDVLVDAKVALSEVKTEALASVFPQVKDMALSGACSASLEIRGNASALSYGGTVSSRALKVGEYQLDDASAEFAYAGDSLSIKAARAGWKDAVVTAAGSIGAGSGASPQKLALSGRISNFAIPILGTFSSAIADNAVNGVMSGSWALAGDTVNPVASVDIQIPRLAVGKDIRLGDVKIAAGYRAPRVDIMDASFKLGSSPISASGFITLSTKSAPPEYNMKGNFKSLNPAELVKMGLISADLSGSLDGDARVWSNGGVPSYRVFFRDSKFKYGTDLSLTELNGTATLSGKDLSFDNLRTNMNMGYVSLSGTVGNATDEKPSAMPLDLKATITSADIGRLSRLVDPMSRGYQGMINAAAVIKGTAAAPRYTADGSIRGVRAFGLFLPVVNFKNINGDLEHIDLPDVSAIVGRGNIRANGSLVKDDSWRGAVSASGVSVDIRSLTYALDDTMRRSITGPLDFDFEGNGPISAFKGRGHASSPGLSVMGMRLTNVDVPFEVSGDVVIVEKSSADAYGGKVDARIRKNIYLSDWQGQINGVSADMASVYADFEPESEGKITGSANFQLNFTGDSKRTSLQDAEGNIDILDGEISGFGAAQSVSKMIGGRPLRFSSIHVAFNVDGQTVYLLPGSRISAPLDDPAFKYVMVDGSVTADYNTDLSCVGNVNIRALNAFAAGVQGVLSAALENTAKENLLQNFLGSTISGFSKNEFRDVSFKVRGLPGDMEFSNVKVETPMKFDARPPMLAETEGARDDEDRRMQIKVEFPVGPGGNRGEDSTESIGGQVGGQILDQIIKGIVFD